MPLVYPILNFMCFYYEYFATFVLCHFNQFEFYLCVPYYVKDKVFVLSP